jgi:hypothetical protein
MNTDSSPPIRLEATTPLCAAFPHSHLLSLALWHSFRPQILSLCFSGLLLVLMKGKRTMQVKPGGGGDKRAAWSHACNIHSFSIHSAAALQP